jgi:glycosyltransferase involved in cell wall biosynthesis
MDNCLPLLLHNCEGNADLVEVGKNGYLFERTDQAIEHLKELANDSALRLKMGLFSKNMLKEQFSMGQFVQRYRALYGI